MYIIEICQLQIYVDHRDMSVIEICHYRYMSITDTRRSYKYVSYKDILITEIYRS